MSTPHIAWIKQTPIFNTSLSDYSYSIGADGLGNIFVVYQTDGTTSGQTTTGGSDIAVIKISQSTGDIIWVIQQATFNSTNDERSPALSIDNVGNIYIAFQSINFSEESGISVIKLNSSDGSLIWKYQQDIYTSCTKPSIATDSSNNIYVSYQSVDTASGQVTSGGVDIVVAKLEPIAGSVLWLAQQPTFNTELYDNSSTIVVDQNHQNSVYVAYQTYGVASGQVGDNYGDIVIFKLNSNGETLWTIENQIFNTVGYDQCPSITVDSLGSIYVSYSTDGQVSGQTRADPTSSDIAIVKLEPTAGQVLWTQQNLTFNTAGDEGIYSTSICHDSSGCIYLTYTTTSVVSGQTRTTDVLPEDIVITKLNSFGQTLWVYQQPTINTDTMDDSPQVITDNYGGIYVSYSTFGTTSGQTNTGDADMTVVKLQQQQPPCFNHGTKILCMGENQRDIYKPIQDLTQGELIKTYLHGYRRVELVTKNQFINNPSKWTDCMYLHSNGKLIVTGGHSILRDDLNLSQNEKIKQHKYWGNKRYLLDGKVMILSAVSDQFTQITNRDSYTYYHIVLEDDGDDTRHYGIWADGILTESLPRGRSLLEPL